MRNIFIIFVLLLFLIFLIILIKNISRNTRPKEKLISYQLENKTYLLKVAQTPKEWQRGLMFIRKPVDFDGMIFIFPDKQERYFWNQNTFVDLDIYWLDGDKIAGKDYLLSIEKSKKVITVISPVPVDRVIEIIR